MTEELEQKLEQKIEEKIKQHSSRKDEIDREELKNEIMQELDTRGVEGKKSALEKLGQKTVTRREFLKVLGLAGGGLALSSTVSGAWANFIGDNDGDNAGDSSDIDADTLDGKDASEIGRLVSVDSNGNLYKSNSTKKSGTLTARTNVTKTLSPSNTYSLAMLNPQIQFETDACSSVKVKINGNTKTTNSKSTVDGNYTYYVAGFDKLYSSVTTNDTITGYVNVTAAGIGSYNLSITSVSTVTNP